MSDGKKSKLAAIMFTDIAGYSAIMERNENDAMSIIEEHNRLLLPLIEGSEGTIVDAIGDGLLVVFDSVYSACNCALNIHGAIASYNDETGTNRQFRLRIGIHLGDIWHEGDRVYGNGVNIAARLLSLAEPGGICVSDDVHRQLKNKTDAAFEHLGSKQLKNIQQPVVCHRLVTGHEQKESVSESGDIVRDGLSKGLEKLRETGITAHVISEDNKSQFETKLEKKIGSFVETVLDKALNKWESVPQERRQELLGDIKKQDWYSDTHLNINLNKSKKKKHSHDDDDEKDGEDDSKTLIPVGIVASGGFGAGLIITGAMWWIFPLVFIGLMPLGIGISKAIVSRKRRKRALAALPQKQERMVFEVAERFGGRLSVMQMSAQSELSLEQAEAVLDELAKRGYIGQEIDDNGLITYVFPQLLSGSEDSTG